MNDYRQRVIEERGELKSKLARLTDFILSPEYTAIDERQQTLLKEQHSYMLLYKQVLDERIKVFDGKPVVMIPEPESVEQVSSSYVKRLVEWWAR